MFAIIHIEIRYDEIQKVQCVGCYRMKDEAEANMKVLTEIYNQQRKEFCEYFRNPSPSKSYSKAPKVNNEYDNLFVVQIVAPINKNDGIPPFEWE